MNTYNENLQQTVNNTLAALSAQKIKLESEFTSAQYNLYYAQGAEITARDKWADTKHTVKHCQSVNDQSLINDNQAGNLLATVTAANTCVSTGNTNMATAASNVQIASNAIAMLASDIGAALNIATASLFNTDSYKKIQDANYFINEVANDSKNISMLAMEASGKTSEIIATALLNQTKAVNTKVDTLLAATQAELNKFSELAISENKVVSQTTTAEQLAEGALLDAERQAKAIEGAYTDANGKLNLGLSVSVSSGAQISVAFNALPSPLPTFCAQPASGIAIPAAQPRYYLTLVPADKMTMFSTDQAEQLFASWIPGVTTQFYSVMPGVESTPVLLVNDAFNSPIQAGSNYVAFLYIALSMEYKRFIGNFSDLLSAPSQAFIPATTLPLAEKCADKLSSKLSSDVLANQDGSAVGSLCFAAESIIWTEAAKAGAAALDLVKVIGQAAGVDTLSAYSGAVGTSTEQSGVNTVIADEDVLTKAKDALLAVAPSTASWFQDACAVVIDTLGAAYYATIADVQGTAEADAKKAAGQAGSNAVEAGSAAERVIAAIFPADNVTDAPSLADAVRAAAKLATVVADTAVLVVNKKIDFRCILVEYVPVESPKHPDLNLLLSPENQNPPIYFNLNIALQIAPANYVIAIDKPAAQNVKKAKSKQGDAMSPPAESDQSIKLYAVIFDPTTTDNFGNMIQSDKTYRPYILTAVNDSSNKQYLSVLSSALDTLNVFNKDEQVSQ